MKTGTCLSLGAVLMLATILVVPVPVGTRAPANGETPDFGNAVRESAYRAAGFVAVDRSLVKSVAIRLFDATGGGTVPLDARIFLDLDARETPALAGVCATYRARLPKATDSESKLFDDILRVLDANSRANFQIVDKAVLLGSLAP